MNKVQTREPYESCLAPCGVFVCKYNHTVDMILKWTCVGDIDRRFDDLSGRHPQMT